MASPFSSSGKVHSPLSLSEAAIVMNSVCSSPGPVSILLLKIYISTVSLLYVFTNVHKCDESV